jgi:hypothetical protein
MWSDTMKSITVTDAFELILETLEMNILCSGSLSAKFEQTKDSVMARELKEMEEFIGQFERIYRRWLALCARESGGHLSKLPTLAAQGVRTREYTYEETVIEALIQFEGRGDYDEVIDEIGQTVNLSEADLQRTPTYPFNPRWSVAAFNAILQMVNRDLIREEEDGYLTLTEKGRESFAKQFEEGE